MLGRATRGGSVVPAEDAQQYIARMIPHDPARRCRALGPSETPLASVVLFVVIPRGAGVRAHKRISSKLKPTSIIRLLPTVMLSLVAFANRTQGWFPAPSSASA